MLGICFQLLLHFTNQYAARKVSTANALAKLSKYLIPPLFLAFFVCVALGEGMHLCVFHHRYSHFHFQDLFVKDTSLTCWRE